MDVILVTVCGCSHEIKLVLILELLIIAITPPDSSWILGRFGPQLPGSCPGRLGAAADDLVLSERPWRV